MLLRAVKIGAVTYFCNELQIEEAGGLEAAAQKMANLKQVSDKVDDMIDRAKEIFELKPKKKNTISEGEKPEEK